MLNPKDQFRQTSALLMLLLMSEADDNSFKFQLSYIMREFERGNVIEALNDLNVLAAYVVRDKTNDLGKAKPFKMEISLN